MKTYVLVVNILAVYLPIILVGLVLPMITKKSLYFGVNIPEEKSKDKRLKKLTNKYYCSYGISSIIITVLLAYGFFKLEDDRILVGGIFILLLFLTFSFYSVHTSVKKLKKEEGWLTDKKQVVMVDIKNNTNNNSGISAKWFYLPIGIFILTVLYTMIKYSDIPELVPSHFNIQGEVTRYSQKSISSAFTLPVTQLFMTGLMFGIYKIIQKVRFTINPSKPKTSVIQNQIAKRRYGIFMLFISITLNMQFLFIQLMVLQVISLNATGNIIMNNLFLVIILAGVAVLAITTGQSGSRIKVSEEEEGNPSLIQRDDDDFWKVGMFYYNPDDPNLWIEKRFGIGWTMNHGHPVGKVLTVGLILLMIYGGIRFISRI